MKILQSFFCVTEEESVFSRVTEWVPRESRTFSITNVSGEDKKRYLDIAYIWNISAGLWGVMFVWLPYHKTHGFHEFKLFHRLSTEYPRNSAEARR